MELNPEVRKKAVSAFKEELLAAVTALRKSLSEGPLNWPGLDHKILLHRLKGGAGFLGYKELTLVIAQLESNAVLYPQEPQKWLEILDTWESASSSLS